MSVIATCPDPCGQKNRLRPGVRQKCGKCGHEFTPREVLVAALGDKVRDLTPPASSDDSDEDDETPERCDDCDRKICEDCGGCHKCDGKCD